jgi:CelD/BcsL family acetyltransferase involved in cellulose biosynthesis
MFCPTLARMDIADSIQRQRRVAMPGGADYMNVVNPFIDNREEEPRWQQLRASAGYQEQIRQ